MHSAIDGFDPLADHGTPGGLSEQIAAEATRREVLNVLKSYTGYFDLFSELIQNSLDALEQRFRNDASFDPKIWIDIDIEKNRVRVTDNGTGMDAEQFRYCFRPNISFKRRTESRGHKGVGATFVAYGFSYVKLQTKRDGFLIAASMRNGRQWAEDHTGSYGRPKFESHDFNVDYLMSENSGTSVEVIIGDTLRPQLTWIQASSAIQWFDILRIKTPLGGIYLSATERKFDPEVNICVKDLSGTETFYAARNVDYFYPHEIPILNKIKSLSEISNRVRSIPGDLKNQLTKLPDEFKRLDAIYEIWNFEQILKNNTISRNLDDEQKILIQRHKISVYACFMSSAKTWTEFQKNNLKVRPNAVLLRGGLQLASDFMPQGDLLVIPLTSSIGYQAATHVIVHLTDGNPDMGRKVFQPEIKLVAEEISRRVVDIFKDHIALVREDTGAPPLTAARELYQFKKAQEDYRDTHPLQINVNGSRLSIVSVPQSEQDVITLFNQLIGMNFIRGYNIFATTQHERYDCIYTYSYDDNSYKYSDDLKFGVSDSVIDKGESAPFVLEYKFDADGLMFDIDVQKKFVCDIDLLVCWTIGERLKREFTLASYLISDEGSNRYNFGSTHAVYQGHEKRFEVVCLKDLISYFLDKTTEEARQKQMYG